VQKGGGERIDLRVAVPLITLSVAEGKGKRKRRRGTAIVGV